MKLPKICNHALHWQEAASKDSKWGVEPRPCLSGSKRCIAMVVFHSWISVSRLPNTITLPCYATVMLVWRGDEMMSGCQCSRQILLKKSGKKSQNGKHHKVFFYKLYVRCHWKVYMLRKVASTALTPEGCCGTVVESIDPALNLPKWKSVRPETWNALRFYLVGC